MKKSKNFTVVVNSGPMSHSATCAFNFAKAIIEQGQRLSQVFFYKDGVYCSSSLLTPMTDELNLYLQWSLLAQEHKVPLNVCIASALRRGIITDKEAQNNNHSNYNLAEPFHLVGLGQLVKDFDSSHQIIQFGN